LAYLISQPKTGIQQKVFRLKTCPQGVLQAKLKNPDVGFLPLSSQPVLLKIDHLKFQSNVKQHFVYRSQNI
jgi:hypothetical protein